MLVREFLACSEIGASRAVGSETIDTNILRRDANLSLQNLAASGIGLNFTSSNEATILSSLLVFIDISIDGSICNGPIRDFHAVFVDPFFGCLPFTELVKLFNVSAGSVNHLCWILSLWLG